VTSEAVEFQEGVYVEKEPKEPACLALWYGFAFILDLYKKGYAALQKGEDDSSYIKIIFDRTKVLKKDKLQFSKIIREISDHGCVYRGVIAIFFLHQ
jgi:hypothetical protein